MTQVGQSWPKRVAIVHYWLIGPGGGEKVVEEILDLYPDADVFTLVHDPKFSKAFLKGARLHVSGLQKIPFSRKFHRLLLPLMPMALENLDLDGYDLIISSESGPAKGILPSINSFHVCYCHSPMRYIWDQYQEYRKSTSWSRRIFMELFIARLRQWDFVTSARVDAFVANSHHIKRRIQKYYRRDSFVVYPPVSTERFCISEPGDYYLITGRHVAYKRIDLAIDACQKLGRKLVVTGEGPETDRLKRMSGPLIHFAGAV